MAAAEASYAAANPEDLLMQKCAAFWRRLREIDELMASIERSLADFA